MTAPSATCELFVDGVRVPDAGTQLLDARVTALDGLQVSWGRDGPNEQPGPAVCTFDMVDPAAGDSFLDLVHVGSSVVVYATGKIAGGQQTTYDNGSFFGMSGAVKPESATFVNGASGVYSGEMLFVKPPASTTAPNFPGVIVPPRRFVTAGLPTQWDSIRKASSGDVWNAHVVVTAPVGTPYTIGLVAYATPYTGGYQSGFTYTMPGNTGTGTGAAQAFDLTATITALPTPAWLAIRVDHADDPNTRSRWSAQVDTWETAVGKWNDWSRTGAGMYIDDLALYPPTSTARRVMVFNGNVSDIKIAPDTESQVSVTCTAADIGAELGNRIIGDDPWPQQTMIARANRIMTLAGLPLSNLKVDSPLDGLLVSYRDVDAQSSYLMLQDLAQTVGGTLWTAIHITTGSYMWVENPAKRVSVKEFTGDATSPVLDATNPATNPALEIGTIANWISNNAAAWPASVDSTAPISGSYSALSTLVQATPGSTAGGIYVLGSGPGSGFPVTAGQSVTASIDIKPEYTRRCTVYLQWFNASGGVVSSSPATYTQIEAGQVMRLTTTATAPAGAAGVRVVCAVITVTGNAVTGERVWYDRVRVGGTDYFDGDTPADGPYSYRWTGTAKASSSERLTGGEVIYATNGADNPGLEDGTTLGWNSNSVAAYPVALDTTSGAISGNSAVSTRTDQSLNNAVASLYLAPRAKSVGFPVTPGVLFTASWSFKCERANRGMRGYCQWVNAAGAIIASDPTSTLLVDSGAAGTQYRVTLTGMPPANAATTRVIVTAVTTNAGLATVGERVWFDNLRVGGTEYFDGDTPSDGVYYYRWTGTARASTSQKYTGGEAVTITGGGAGSPLSACDILMEPVSWEQDTGDVITVVALTWQEQTLDDDGKPAPTERTVITQDDGAIATYGTRRLSYATELTQSADAAGLAERLLNTARSIGWRMDGVTLDTLNMPDDVVSIDDTTRATVFLDLLDGTLRMGYGLYLVDLPAYAPGGDTNGVYVEGGRYTFAAGGWALDLTVTPSGGQGKSATWADMGRTAWAWRDFDPAIRWVDCYGTSVP